MTDKSASGQPIQTAVHQDPAITTQTVVGAPAALSAADLAKVTVKPLRHFLDSETGKHVTPHSEPFEVTRHHAVQLRQNGLVEFENEGDEHAAVSEQVKAHKDAVAARAKQGEIPANSKGTPLKNPKLNY